MADMDAIIAELVEACEKAGIKVSVLTSEDFDHIGPCTIVADRYGGTYSAAVWTAWRLDAWDVPDDIASGDTPCMEFWKTFDGLVGKGSTPAEAYEDLKKNWRAMNHG